jgi:hypothetical protein
MKEDILNKKKEVQKKGNSFQVEIVGLPEGMMLDEGP